MVDERIYLLRCGKVYPCAGTETVQAVRPIGGVEV